jgi:REP element-mobilizing transposase RayT
MTNGQMELNPMGAIAHNACFKPERMRPNMRLYEFIVMPNPIHGIIKIIPPEGRIACISVNLSISS